MIEKCCFCFNLKYGYLTYAIIYLLCRVAMITFIYYWPNMFEPAYVEQRVWVYSVVGLSMGWLIVATYFLYLSFRGVIEKRPIFLYPYMVVLLVEILVLFILNIVEWSNIHPGLKIFFTVIGVINGYSDLCLISLYRKFTEEERNAEINGSTDRLLTNTLNF